MANDKFFRKVKRIKPIEPKKARRIRRSDTMFFYRELKRSIKHESKKGFKSLYTTYSLNSSTHRAVRLFALKNKGFEVVRMCNNQVCSVSIAWGKKHNYKIL